MKRRRNGKKEKENGEEERSVALETVCIVGLLVLGWHAVELEQYLYL